MKKIDLSSSQTRRLEEVLKRSQEVPHQMASDAIYDEGIGFKDDDPVKMFTEKGEYIIKARPKSSYTFPSEDEKEKAIRSLFYVHDKNNEKAWVIDGDEHDEVTFYVTSGLDFQYYINIVDENVNVTHESERIERLENTVIVKELKEVSNTVTKRYEGITKNGEDFEIRYRSGSLTAKLNGEVIFEGFIGKEFPGSILEKEEIIGLVGSMEYISLPENIHYMG